MCVAFFRLGRRLDVIEACILTERPEIETDLPGLKVISSRDQDVFLVDIDQTPVKILQKLSEVTEIPNKILGGDERQRILQ